MKDNRSSVCAFLAFQKVLLVFIDAAHAQRSEAADVTTRSRLAGFVPFPNFVL